MTFIPEIVDRPRAASRAQQHMVDLFDRIAPTDGFTQSCVRGVKLLRASRPAPRRPVMYEPSIVIVCQGRKRGYFGDQVVRYDAQQYLVLSVPLPFECETEASEAEPLLAISACDVDLAMVAELLMALDDSARQHASRAARHLFDAARCGCCPMRSSGLLGRAWRRRSMRGCSRQSIVREICYRVLTGEQGRCDSRGADASDSISAASQRRCGASTATTATRSTSIRWRARRA